MTNKSFIVFTMGTLCILFSLTNCKPEITIEEPTTNEEITLSTEEPDERLDSIPIHNRNQNKKYIYITFDDGPNKGTKNVVKVIKKEKVPVTMFVIGSHIYGSQEQLSDFGEIFSDSIFQIGNHSYSHANNQYAKYYKDSIGVLADFNRVNDSLNRALYIARTPGRNIWRTNTIQRTDIQSSAECADYLMKNNYKLIGWDLEWHSNPENKIKETGEEMMVKIDSLFQRKRTQTENHLVLLAHDQYFRDSLSANELEKFVQVLKTRDDIEIRKIKDYPDLYTIFD